MALKPIYWDCGCTSYPSDDAADTKFRERGCPNHPAAKETAAPSQQQAGDAKPGPAGEDASATQVPDPAALAKAEADLAAATAELAKAEGKVAKGKKS